MALSLVLSSLASTLTPAQAAPNLADVRAKVRTFQEDAAAAAEGAQQAQVEYNKLTKTLATVEQAAKLQSGNVDSLKKTLGTIASEQYKSAGLSQSMELLFSSDPTLYLGAAGSLESITKINALKLRRYSVAKQRLNATSLTVNDKLAQAKAAKARYVAAAKSANEKLAQAQALLNSLSAAERARLAALVNSQEDADQAASLAAASKLNFGSGRGATAVKFALKQIGDKYVFGAAGLIYWDCSGLVMRAFQQAGVSLPHSAAAQAGSGKRISLGSLRPGDIVFFAHRGGGISHDGIYIGGGRMVHAPHTGARVKVTEFGATFGSLHFVGGRRL